MSDEAELKTVAEARPTEGRSHFQIFKSEQLFGSSNEIEILHAGAIYRLKVTRQGKLILNK